MRVLLDVQALQTPGAAERGVGTYTNGLLRALVSRHEVLGLRRAGPYLVPASAEVATLELPDTQGLLARTAADLVIHCASPFWRENAVVSAAARPDGALVASVFYDAIPWVFPEHYLAGGRARQDYHNRCVDLYAAADLVCGISQSASADALRFGYATAETIATIGAGREPLACGPEPARQTWSIARPYLLSVSGDDFRKNPEALIDGYLRSRVRDTHDLVLVISNDAQTGFSRRLAARHPAARLRGVRVLPQVEEAQLGALYRDCVAFVYASLYEGFGIPLVEAMQAGKWIIAPSSSSIGEVAGAALLETMTEPRDAAAIAAALDRAGERLSREARDPAVPRAQAARHTWSGVVDKLEQAVQSRRAAPARPGRKPTLYWASPFPAERSGIAFYSNDLVPLVARAFEIVIVPNDAAQFVPTPGTGRCRMALPDPQEFAQPAEGGQPLVFYHLGNSNLHLEILALLFRLPGVVLLHDTVLTELTLFWNEHVVRVARLGAWLARLGRLDNLLQPSQPTLTRRAVGRIARLPGMRMAIRAIAARCRSRVRARTGTRSADLPFVTGPAELAARIVESSRAMVFLCEHAKAFLPQDIRGARPQHVVPLYARAHARVSPADRAALRRKYAIPEQAFVVTTTGFQAPIKLTHRVAAACLELQRIEAAPVYLQVLGELAPDAYRDEVHAVLAGSAMQRFVSDAFIDEAALIERTALSDVAVFLRASSTGGPSAGLNDALGMGLPCVVTDDFAFQEYPRGAFRPIANDALVEELRRLYRDPREREALSAAGLRFARDHAPSRIAERLCATLARYAGA